MPTSSPLSLEPPTSAPASPAMALDRAMGIWGLWLVREGVSGIFCISTGQLHPDPPSPQGRMPQGSSIDVAVRLYPNDLERTEISHAVEKPRGKKLVR
jgi:hypothetical protein